MQDVAVGSGGHVLALRAVTPELAELTYDGKILGRVETTRAGAEKTAAWLRPKGIPVPDKMLEIWS